MVLCVYPGCETADMGEQSMREDRVQHQAYASLRDSFASAMPGGAIVAVSMCDPTEQLFLAYQLQWQTKADVRRVAHYLTRDHQLKLADAFGLPVREHVGRRYYERATMIAREGRIQHVFDSPRAGQDAHQALAWLQLH
jgi:peroxiredoxin